MHSIDKDMFIIKVGKIHIIDKEVSSIRVVMKIEGMEATRPREVGLNSRTPLGVVTQNTPP